MAVGAPRRGTRIFFPSRRSADATFNSALIYELSRLKNRMRNRCCYGIQKGEPEYFEAKRLLKFLDYFLGRAAARILPKNSILREFVGGSCFRRLKMGQACGNALRALADIEAGQDRDFSWPSRDKCCLKCRTWQSKICGRGCQP